MKYLLSLTCVALVGACKDSPEPTRAVLDPVVRTASWPVTSLAQALAPDSISVLCSLPSGGDPITWQPTRDEIAAFQRAQRIVLNGAGLEGWLRGVSLPASRVIDTSAPLKAVLINLDDGLHSHGPRGTHSHGGIDPHTFLDPHQLKAMAGAIRDGFQAAWPQQAAQIEERFVLLAAEIDALDKDLLQLTKLLGERTLLASHPAYDYLARRYGWHLTSLDLDPASLPTPEQNQQITALVTAQQPILLLWESAPSAPINERIQGTWGLPSVVWDPCESPPSTGTTNFIKRQRANAARLTALLR